MIVTVDDEPPPVLLTAEKEAALDESIAQAERGDFASDEEVGSIWTKHGRLKT